MQDRHRPCDEAAPIVPCEHRALDPERIEQRNEIAGQVLHSVRFDGFRRVARAIAALVRRDDAKSGLGERADLMPPGIRELRETVAEHDRRALPRFVDRQRDSATRQVNAASGREIFHWRRAGSERALYRARAVSVKAPAQRG